MLDDELQDAIEQELDVDCDHIFISSVSNKNITELKDKLWVMMND